MTDKLIPFKSTPKVPPSIECLRILLKEVEALPLVGYVVMVETSDEENRYLFATNNVGVSLIGMMEVLKRDLIEKITA